MGRGHGRVQAEGVIQRQGAARLGYGMLFDLGPEGGDGGGRIIATGPPEDVAAQSASYTGRYLAAILASPAKTTKKNR